MGVESHSMSNSYFSIFNLPLGYNIDKSSLEDLFVKAQQKFHPDKFVTASDVDRITALNNTIEINHAYQVLKDDLKRAAYLLELAGVVVNEDSRASAKAKPEVLAEMMELGERLEEASTEDLLLEASGNYKKLKLQALKLFSDAHDVKNIHEATQQYLRAKFLDRLIDNARAIIAATGTADAA